MGIIDGGKRYTKDIVIPYYEGDFHNQIKLPAILQYAQQISMEHCDHLGMGAGAMNAIGKVFLLAKLSVEIERMPRVGEKLTLITAPSLPKRAQYKRATTFLDEEGNTVITLDSRWVLVDQENRRIERNLPPELPLPQVDSSETLEHAFLFPKATQLEEKHKILVGYSLLDVNHHINNAQYASLACDALPIEVLENSTVEKLLLNYNREAKAGETVTIFTQQLAEGEYYILGEVQEKKCFESYMRFRKEK